MTLFTDGACSGNPGPGGWGALLRYGAHEKELSGGEPATTNNRMEMLAVIHGLEALKKPAQVRIYTDSQYVMKGMTEWLAGWKRNGWVTASKKPVQNAELWHDLIEVAGKHQIEWTWVKGHAGNRYNEQADKLAVEAIRKLNL